MVQQIFSLYIKKIRNRIPDSVKEAFNKHFLPYSGIIIVTCFVLVSGFAHAAENNKTISSDYTVMDLQPVEAAQVVSSLSAYTPNVQEDSVNVLLAMEDQNYLDKPTVFGTAQTVIPEEKRQSTINYTVQGGDTLSSIGWQFGLKINTIKYTNSLNSDVIQPGKVLKLPPADISPDVIKKLAAQAKQKVLGTAKVNRSPGSKSNAYPYGWCTYYVATRRYVPGGWGNASVWLGSAARSGYATGSSPAAGAIVVTSESWMGHVAYVESVHDGMITISEMNYRGWGMVSSRTISASSGVIRGYIY